MTSIRIQNHPILGPSSKQMKIHFTFNGVTMEGYADEPIAAALLANGIRLLRRHEESGAPRGIYCAIGHCMECRVNVQGKGPVRACITPLTEAMSITSGQQLANEITGRDLYDGKA